MTSAADLIQAKLDGKDFEQILSSFVSVRESAKSSPEAERDAFFASMLDEIKKAVGEFEQSVGTRNLDEIKGTCVSLDELFQMVQDCCDEATREAQTRQVVVS